MKDNNKTKYNIFILIVSILVITLLVAIFAIIYLTLNFNRIENDENFKEYVEINFDDLKEQLTPSIINEENTSIFTNINFENDNIVDITSFGAVANDDVDDTDAINNAINSLPNGGLVYIPSGVYIINVIECVNLKNNITMFGDGNSSVLKLADS